MRTTNLSVSNSEPLSSSFFLLDKRIQRWIWDSGWDELKDIQEFSIPLILDGQKDVILAAATASGKTEAAFLPILTKMLQEPEIGSVLYISPLKALINDQFGRLELLCEKLEIPVTPWHGDIGATKKKKFLQSQKGVVLITPESLEAMLMLRGHQIPNIFEKLRYIVIDELHAFIGSERGKQLQSQMHRLDVALKRATPRIALSATLGDMEKAGKFLRPKSPVMAEIIESKSDARELKISVKGYEGDELEYAFPLIGEDLFQKVRGSNNLVFPNSRQKVEFLADELREQSERQRVENEFFPHHGSLSKELREETEAALKSKKPITAICTMTLELGIDIGDIKTVGQISCAPSVASLRQRLGRSGRRKGESAILRGYVIEDEIDAHGLISDRLREQTIQFIAQISLLFQRWYEPPRIQTLHLSTLIQQLLSLIAQYQGILAIDAWQILCGSSFNNVSKDDFIALLRHLGMLDIVMQDSSGILLHGIQGEKIVNDYKFYAAFQESEEYRIVHNHKTLGTLPADYYVEIGDCIIFAGKRWLVQHIQKGTDKIMRIDVVPDTTGKLPKFSGGGFCVDDRVRQEMYQILLSTRQYPFLDKTAARFLNEARSEFQLMRLGEQAQTMLDCGDKVLIFPWRGSRVIKTICLILKIHGVEAHGCGCFRTSEKSLYVEVKTSKSILLILLQKIIDLPIPDEANLVENVLSKQPEKWDYLLPEPLLSKNYASSMLDVDSAIKTIRELLELYA
jgi:ATP-dependent Lhr-like helicase